MFRKPTKYLVLFAVIVLVCLTAGIATAAPVTQSITYQGKLTNAVGSPLTGTYGVTFTFYDAITGGTALSTDTHSVTATNGLFTTSIAVANPTVVDGRALWLGIKAGADTEMTPRQEIRPVPYALNLRPDAWITGTDVSSALNLQNIGGGKALNVSTNAFGSKGISIVTNGQQSAAVHAIANGIQSNAIVGETNADGPAAVAGLTTGKGSYGLYGKTTGGPGSMGVYTITSGPSSAGVYTITSGDNSNGVHASVSGKNSNGIDVLTTNSGSNGVNAWTNGDNSNGVIVSTIGGGSDGVMAVTSGIHSNGVYVKTTGNQSIALNVSTSGYRSFGVRAITNYTQTHGVWATTLGANSNALWGNTVNTGSSAIRGLTAGDNSAGISLETYGTDSNGVEVQTANATSHGVYARTAGAGSNGVEAVTTGANSHAIVAHTSSTASDGLYAETSAWGSWGVDARTSGDASYGVSGSATGGQNSFGVNAFSAQSNGLYAHTGRIDQKYGIYTPDYLYAKGAQVPTTDVAEYMPVGENVAPGTVLVIGDDGKLQTSSAAYDTGIAGIVSTAPGVILGTKDNGNPGEQIIAVAGRVPCKVDTSNGPIHPRDLLTTSNHPGYAMKATNPQVGTVLGKAMGSLESGTGTIEVLVTLQ